MPFWLIHDTVGFAVSGRLKNRWRVILEKDIFKSGKHRFILRFVKLINVLLITVPIVVCWYGYYARGTRMQMTWKRSFAIIALFIVVYFLLGKAYDAFLVSYNRIFEMFLGQMVAILISDTIMFIVLWIVNWVFPNLIPALLALLAQLLLSMLWCVGAHRWYFWRFPPKRAAVIYDTRQGMENLMHEYGLDKKFKVCHVVHIDECLKDLSFLDKMQTAFFSGIHSHERNIVLKYCVEHGVSCLVIPRVGDVLMSGARPMHLFHLPMLLVERYNPSPEYLFVKRFLDILMSGVMLILISPIMLVTALAIKLQDHGPVFYKQVRLTKDRKEFKILKFRSMRVDAEKDGVARLSSGENDDRITKVGRFIRKCRIDELPQLINILKGDMSFVGPRPERPEIAVQYEEEMPEFGLRLQAKAGLTGYAQVYGQYNSTPYDKLLMDLAYIANPSVRQDVMLFFSTIKILFMKESTEGIDAGSTTALKKDGK